MNTQMTGPKSSIGLSGVSIMPDNFVGKGVKVMCHMCGDDMYILGVDDPAICPKCMNKTRTMEEEIRYTGYMALFKNGGRRKNGQNS